MTWAGRTFGCGRPAVVFALLTALAAGACSGRDEESAAGGAGGVDSAYGYLDEPFRVRPGVLLARPSEQEEQNTTFVRLIDMIRHTPPGARIRIVAHSFSFVPVAEALVDAHERGVRVQVLSDRSVSGAWKAPALLREALGTHARAGSFVRLVPGELHEKTWTFSRTGESRDVTLVGSMNLTYKSAGQYTDTYVYAGRPDVRTALDQRFDQLVRELPDVSPAASPRWGSDQVWFYPGYSEQSDPVRTLLEAVPAVGAELRVVMYAWLDERGISLAELLAEKAAEGAEVEVVLGPSVGPRPRAILEGSAVVTHDGVFADGDDVHHKLTTVTYIGAEGRRHRFVLTGSDNFTSRSLRRPELLLRIDADRGPTWQRYQEFIDAIVARARREADVG